MTLNATRARGARIFFLAAFSAFAFQTRAAAQYSVRRTPDLVQLELEGAQGNGRAGLYRNWRGNYRGTTRQQR
jgi:hypothetical protein